METSFDEGILRYLAGRNRTRNKSVDLSEEPSLKDGLGFGSRQIGKPIATVATNDNGVADRRKLRYGMENTVS